MTAEIDTNVSKPVFDNPEWVNPYSEESCVETHTASDEGVN